ncbi:MAG: hypothetical protein M1482_08070 [Chloroflexi bacterium]|nr:hypothetical protein [Chloroflexota bacterium]
MTKSTGLIVTFLALLLLLAVVSAVYRLLVLPGQALAPADATPIVSAAALQDTPEASRNQAREPEGALKGPPRAKRRERYLVEFAAAVAVQPARQSGAGRVLDV